MKTLNMFVHVHILQQIGHARLARFLDAFDADLQAMNLFAPPPLPATHYYFTEVADFLANTENLPPRFLQAMTTIESAASPENSARLDVLIQHHVPNVSFNRSCPLDCALELWFASPETLNSFPIASSSSSSSSSDTPSFEVQGSTAESAKSRSAVG